MGAATPTPCPLCRRGGAPSSAWTVCFLTAPSGRHVHESFYFGPGSTLTDAQAEAWALTWVAVHLRESWPAAVLRSVHRVAPDGSIRPATAAQLRKVCHAVGR